MYIGLSFVVKAYKRSAARTGAEIISHSYGYSALNLYLDE